PGDLIESSVNRVGRHGDDSAATGHEVRHEHQVVIRIEHEVLDPIRAKVSVEIGIFVPGGKIAAGIPHAADRAVPGKHAAGNRRAGGADVDGGSNAAAVVNPGASERGAVSPVNGGWCLQKLRDGARYFLRRIARVVEWRLIGRDRRVLFDEIVKVEIPGTT